MALYDRLLIVCRDQGIEQPRNADIVRLVGLSSGRVTQIKQAEGAAKLGEDALRRLVRLGYSADWLQDGRGEMRLTTNASALLLELFEKLPPQEQARIIDFARWQLMQHETEEMRAKNEADPHQDIRQR